MIAAAVAPDASRASASSARLPAKLAAMVAMPAASVPAAMVRSLPMRSPTGP
jgi:hypothetical protein